MKAKGNATGRNASTKLLATVRRRDVNRAANKTSDPPRAKSAKSADNNSMVSVFISLSLTSLRLSSQHP
jgi:hypothetical protein